MTSACTPGSRQPGARLRLPLRVGLGLLAGLSLLAGCASVPETQRASWSVPSHRLPSAVPSPVPTAPPSPSPSVSSPPSAPAPADRYVFPVQGKASYAHTHHDYPASDIMAACGLPVVAVTSGVVLEISPVDSYDPQHPAGADRGGISVSLLGDDGVRYYGSHLSTVQPGVQAGVRVAAGARLGSVGETGNASACHLHFGISPPCQRAGDWWTRRGAVWPWPYLDAWRAGQSKSPAAEVAAWQRQQGCPASAPAGA